MTPFRGSSSSSRRGGTCYCLIASFVICVAIAPWSSRAEDLASEDYYGGDYYYDLYYDDDYDYSGPSAQGFSSGPRTSSSSQSKPVPSSSDFTRVVSQKSAENQRVAKKVQSHVVGNGNNVNVKLIPQPGWVPLPDSKVGQTSPAITFLQHKPVTPAHTSLSSSGFKNVAPPNLSQQPAAAGLIQPQPTTVTRVMQPKPKHFIQQQKPTHRPVIVQQKPTHKPIIIHKSPPVSVTSNKQQQGSSSSRTNFGQLLTLNSRPTAPTTTTTLSSSRAPITVNPTDTIIIHYNTLSGGSSREERDLEELPFDERIAALPLDCKDIVQALIKDILEAPLRKRNSLLGMLRMKENIKNAKATEQTFPERERGTVFRQKPRAPPPPPPPTIATSSPPQPSQEPRTIVSQTFSNFPGFQQKSPNNNNRNNKKNKLRTGGATAPTITGQFINANNRAPKNFAQTPKPRTTRPPPPPRTTTRTTTPRTTTRTTQRPAPPVTTVFTQPPRRFVPEQIFSSEEQSLSSVESNSNSGDRQAGFTIEQFLERYPEVRRVSSRFGDENNESAERVVGNLNNITPRPPKRKSQASGSSGGNGNGRNGRRKKNRRKNKKKNKQQQQQVQQIVVTTSRPSITFPPTTRPTRPPTTRRTTTRPPPPPPTTTRRPPPPPVTTRRPRPPPPTTRPSPPPPPSTTQAPVLSEYDDYDYEDEELSSDDYSYLYYQEYYDELVPEHHRFFDKNNKPRTTTTTTTPRPTQRRKPKTQTRRKKKKNKNQQRPKQAQNQEQKQPKSFSFFSSQPKDFAFNGNNGFPNFPNSITTTTPKPKHKAKPKQKPVAIVGDGDKAGPFGYVEKGTFFEDSAVTGFPEMVEVIYQGFVWAFDIRYGDEGGGRIMHGGIHEILKDKVKRERVFLKDDYIVRISGRASPYNINRLTFYTAKGKKFGPWGDRRSKESVDFDVHAPPGHALAFFSGTVDFGVPLRSVSFHWRPIPS